MLIFSLSLGQIVSSLRAHLESTVPAETMTQIESTADEFLKRFMLSRTRSDEEAVDDSVDTPK